MTNLIENDVFIEEDRLIQFLYNKYKDELDLDGVHHSLYGGTVIFKRNGTYLPQKITKQDLREFNRKI